MEKNDIEICKFLGWYKKDQRCKNPLGRLEVPEHLHYTCIDESVQYDCPHINICNTNNFDSINGQGYQLKQCRNIFSK